MNIANMSQPIYAEQTPAIVTVMTGAGIARTRYVREDRVWWLIKNFDANKCPSDWCACDFNCRDCWIKNA